MLPFNNRRSGVDRRKNKQPVLFPIRDSKGDLVTKERRTIANRRTEGLELTVSNISKKEFDEYFKNSRRIQTYEHRLI